MRPSGTSQPSRPGRSNPGRVTRTAVASSATADSDPFARSAYSVSSWPPRISPTTPGCWPRRRPSGYSLVALAAVADRTRELHALDASATADVPSTHAEDDFRYEDWLEETLAHPQLSLDGSAVVLFGGEPVAYALVHVDPGTSLAANEMTGTRADRRRRGLARLAKLATIAWARENGFEAILTSTDGENLPMLGLNESLGYETVTIETEYLLEDLR